MKLSEALHAALAQVPGPKGRPARWLPTLPFPQVEYGQQHVLLTFCPPGGPPPPTLLVPEEAGVFGPAVTLHLLWPGGYSYWQPETGTSEYVGPALTAAQLPAPYQQLLLAADWPQLTSSASARDPAQLTQYLDLLEQVLANEWLLGHHPDPAAEKIVATQLLLLLPTLVDSEWEAYYQARGQGLFEWLGRATYEPNWLEQAQQLIIRTAPDWLPPPPGDPALTLGATELLPAVLDGRPCTVVAFYLRVTSPAAPAGRVYPPHAACYVSYPDGQVQWQALKPGNYPDLLACARDEAGRFYVGPAGPAPAAASRQLYQQLVSVVLARGWLLTRYPATAEEISMAQALQVVTQELFAPPPWAAYYRHSAWQLLAWVERVAGVGGPAARIG